MAGLIDQVWIFFWSTASLALNYSKTDLKRWGPVAGLIAQPAWYYTAWVNHQWGMMGLNLIITCIHIYGLQTQWVKKKAAPVKKRPQFAYDSEGNAYPIKYRAGVSTI